MAIDRLNVIGTKKSFHQKFSWKAEDFFDDTQVVSLCKAIEADDLAEMKRLIEAGADVNAKGKGSMTPLMWAFPDNKFDRFKLLLENGADPNVKISSDLNVPSFFRPGHSVTTVSAKSYFPGKEKVSGTKLLLNSWVLYSLKLNSYDGDLTEDRSCDWLCSKLSDFRFLTPFLL